MKVKTDEIYWYRRALVALLICLAVLGALQVLDALFVDDPSAEEGPVGIDDFFIIVGSEEDAQIPSAPQVPSQDIPGPVPTVPSPQVPSTEEPTSIEAERPGWHSTEGSLDEDRDRSVVKNPSLLDRP